MASALAVLLCGIWDVISPALNSCLGSAVGDSLNLLWGRVVAEVREFTRFWGNRVEQVPISATCDLAGLEEIRRYEREIADCLRDDRVGVIGIQGMGGVGKTTLLERINNNFSEIGAPDFDVVIYVTVSQEASVPSIQKSIGKRIDLNLSAAGDSCEERANLIFKTLQRSRFLLLLDDVWEEIRLKDIGIPQPTAENKCKVILTTRSKEVCQDMGAKKLVEMKELNEEESWRLFKENVGTGVDLDSPRINPYAKAVAGKCGGLPLVLNTVGRAMADANSVAEWKAALTQLKVSPHSMRGMTDKVLLPLYFSYERLSYETLKQCLLYCCLYPEDETIKIREIIEQWVGEGFLDQVQSNSVVECRNRGHGVIPRLVKASLLQNASKGCVKMHDAVREMCLWLSGEDQNVDKNNAFLVLTSEVSNCMSSFGRWKGKRRISMMANRAKHLPDSAPSCPNLETLFLCRRRLSSIREHLIIPRGFFNYMSVLRVLDLSRTELEDLPDDVGFLTDLRYLNLQATSIKSLPKGFGKLRKLIQLNLNYTRYLRHIPPEAIPVLTRLRVLGMFDSYDILSLLAGNMPTTNDRWGDHDQGESSSTPSTPSSLGVSSRDEPRWSNLEEIELLPKSLDSFKLLLSSGTLRKSCVNLKIDGVHNIPATDLALAFGSLENVQHLYVQSSSMEGEEAVRLHGASDFGQSLEGLHLFRVLHLSLEVTAPSSFRSLCRLHIFGCHSIYHVDWVRQLPCLKIIYLADCNNIRELLLPMSHHPEDHCDSSSFLSLEKLELRRLHALTSVSSRPMLFPALRYLKVRNCRKLQKLPLVPSSAPNMYHVGCSKSLWESLDAGTQSRFRRFYHMSWI